MKNTRPLDRRLLKLERITSALTDCWLESRNNITRGELDLAETNLRKLFRNARDISQLRPSVMRALRKARRAARI